MITLVVPPLDGPTTGGTRYNRCLVRALRELDVPCEVLSWERARAVVGEPVRRMVWVDSLWIDRVRELADVCSPQCTIGLLTHYLPVLVEHGERPSPSRLREGEGAALEVADAFVVPSEYLADELVWLGVERERVWVIEPGIELPREPYAPRPVASEPLRALVIANVTEGKGILLLLRGLASELRSEDELELTIVGSTELDPRHGERCRSLVAERPGLRGRARFAGPREHAECIEMLLESDVLVSASRMESYGMALAEARACGRPILARTGGNVARHVDPRWGGRLVSDARELARACVALARDRQELGRRQALAWADRPRRAWSEVARALLSVARDRPPPRPPQ